MTIISADSHLLLLDEHVLAHLAPEHHEAYLAIPGPHRRAGVTPDTPGDGPAGEWDPQARIADMDLDQVQVEVLYSDATAGGQLYKLGTDAGRAAMTAFNSAALDFAAYAPDRLVIVHQVPLHDLAESSDYAVAEIERLAAAGARAVQVPLYPQDVGLPMFWDDAWEPVWAAIAEARMPISLHVCPPKGRGLGADPTPARGVFQVLPPIMMSQALAEFVLTGVFQRHTGLRVVLVEAGLGWIPYFLDRLDLCHEKGEWKDKGMPIDGLPSDYWRTNMAATFEEDPAGIAARDQLGVENLMWASDYPHPDQTFPFSAKVIEEAFADCTADEKRLMTNGNAARLYRL